MPHIEQAARHGHTPAAAFLLDHAPFEASKVGHQPAARARATREMVTEADHFGNSPLHVACREGHLEVVALLLTRGADPAARNRYGWTPLIAASGMYLRDDGPMDGVGLPELVSALHRTYPTKISSQSIMIDLSYQSTAARSRCGLCWRTAARTSMTAGARGT